MSKIKEIIVTAKYTVRWYFQYIMYECLLNDERSIIISTIDRYKYMADQLLVTLKMYGWILDDGLDENPYSEITRGKNVPLHMIKYHVILDPTLKSIWDDIRKDKKSNEILLHLLDRMDDEKQTTKKIDSEFMENKKVKELLTVLVDLIDKRKNA